MGACFQCQSTEHRFADCPQRVRRTVGAVGGPTAEQIAEYERAVAVIESFRVLRCSNEHQFQFQFIVFYYKRRNMSKKIKLNKGKQSNIEDLFSASASSDPG